MNTLVDILRSANTSSVSLFSSPSSNAKSGIISVRDTQKRPEDETNTMHVTKGSRSQIAAFQKRMKKMVMSNTVAQKVAELNEMDMLIYSCANPIDTYMVNHSYYLEELLLCCRIDQPIDLKFRAIRLISSICDSSKLLRSTMAKKGAIMLFNANLLEPSTPHNVVRWIIHILRSLATQDDFIVPLLFSKTQAILEDWARKDWSDWGNNDAEDILKLCDAKK